MSGDAEIFGRSLPSSAICGAVCRSLQVAGTEPAMRRRSSTITTGRTGTAVTPAAVVGAAPVGGGGATAVVDGFVPGIVVFATESADAGAPVAAAAVAATPMMTTA